MSKKIYVGNLNYVTNEDALKDIFSAYGDIASISIIRDRFTEQSKGFGFVEFTDDSAADAAISGVNGREVDGRRVRVNIAEERRDRRSFGDRDRNYGGGRGGYDGRSDFGGRSDYGRGGFSHGEYNRDDYNRGGYGGYSDRRGGQGRRDFGDRNGSFGQRRESHGYGGRRDAGGYGGGSYDNDGYDGRRYDSDGNY